MIYLDNASTTPMLPNVYQKVLPWMSGEKFGNPSSLHQAGCEAREAVETARQYVADMLHAENKDDIIFTSGGTESDNLAMLGLMTLCKNYGRKTIITSPTEHHAILRTCDYLAENGFQIIYAPVDNNGIIQLDKFIHLVDKNISNLGLVSIMAVNNETGAMQPIKEIALYFNERGDKALFPFMTDAVQAVGHMYIDVKEWGVDMLSLSAHKFGGPDGIGALYVRDYYRSVLSPLIRGGKQEFLKRAGTENVAGIVGLGEAARYIQETLPRQIMKYYWLGQLFLEGVRNGLPGGLEENGIRVNCKGADAVGNILSLTVSGVEAESLLLLMDADGVCISAASACTAGSLNPSHVLKAMGMSDSEAHSTVRISFGVSNTDDEAVEAGRIFAKNVNRIRAMYGGYN